MAYSAYTKHLEERKYQRLVDHDEIQLAMSHPDSFQHLGGTKYKFFKYLNGRTVVVVANTAAKPWVVITTWTKPGSYSAESTDPFLQRLGMSLLKKLVNLFSGNKRSH